MKHEDPTARAGVPTHQVLHSIAVEIARGQRKRIGLVLRNEPGQVRAAAVVRQDIAAVAHVDPGRSTPGGLYAGLLAKKREPEIRSCGLRELRGRSGRALWTKREDRCIDAREDRDQKRKSLLHTFPFLGTDLAGKHAHGSRCRRIVQRTCFHRIHWRLAAA